MLTKSEIDRARPAQTPFILWDDQLAGFGCRIHPTGKRSFVVRYRRRGSRQLHQIMLGTYGKLTVAEARNRARELLAEAQLDRDPRRLALTVQELVAQYRTFLEIGAGTSKRLRGRPLSASHLNDTLLHLRRFTAAYGKQKASTVRQRDVSRLLDHYANQPSVHRRMHGAIRRMYVWARARELVDNAPADHIETTSPAARQRVLTLAELAVIWTAAEQLEPVYGDAVKLMIATGQRRGEVAGMLWGEIDLIAGTWTLPAARTKSRRQHVLPLPELATAALQARRAGVRDTPAADDLVLPTLQRDGRGICQISGWNWLKRELDSRSGVSAWQLHDFRRSFVTICAEHGADIAVLDSMLNHASSATRGGIVGVYQLATLVGRARLVMGLWDGLLRGAIRSDHSENSTQSS